MEKRYQVFVSSTFADLQQERNAVIQTLMKMDCIPAGMELFPAIDQEQFDFIKKIIDDCDYYLLIISGRYGSVAPDGVSYTEKEYEYAISKGMKVIAFLKRDLDQVTLEKTDRNEELFKRLTKFRDRVAEGRLVEFWDKVDELPGKVALSLMTTMKTYPAIGWIRGDAAASFTTIEQNNALLNENNALKAKILEMERNPAPRVDGMAGLDDEFTINYTVYMDSYGGYVKIKTVISRTWKEIFVAIARNLGAPTPLLIIRKSITEIISKADSHEIEEIDSVDLSTIKIHLKALGLIKSEIFAKNNLEAISLTQYGEALLVEEAVAKKK